MYRLKKTYGISAISGTTVECLVQQNPVGNSIIRQLELKFHKQQHFFLSFEQYCLGIPREEVF